ncbi:MAG TPA: alpha/beta hydrolase [Candidatus Lokiarchaeia archaeon]|nr:alpha/beta hydrolase [Candidatus Lokiarchaeia archaeon]
MVIQLDESKLTPGVRKAFKKDAKRTMKYALFYCFKARMSISKLKGLTNKVAAFGDSLYNSRKLDIEGFNMLFSRSDVDVSVKFFRHVIDKLALDDARKYKFPENVRFEKTNAEGVNAEWQIVPGVSEDKVLLYFHGGGLLFGSAMNVRPFTVDLARKAKVRVLSVDYRLYPEHMSPAQIDDAFAAYTWLLREGIKPSNVIIGGDSAGGLLTMQLLTRLRDTGEQLPAGAICVSPLIDLTFYNDSFYSNMKTETNGPNGLLALACCLHRILDKNIDPTDPAMNPQYASLADLPPLLVQAVSNEMLYGDACRLVEKARADGVDVTLQTWNGMFHDFQAAGVDRFPEMRDAKQKLVEFIVNHLV